MEFGFGSVGLAMLGISTGRLRFALYISVGAGCTINSVTEHIAEQ